jgi:type II secretory pathway pseudopilin PulG
MKKTDGYTILILMFMVFVMSIGLMIAVPVWQTQIQREKEEELIFRGKQYVEAIRLFQRKKPGAFPRDFEELIEEKCLRKLFEDPMSPDGKWNLILLSQQALSSTQRTSSRTGRGSQGRQISRDAGTRSQQRSREQQPTQVRSGTPSAVQRVLIAPQAALSAINNAQIIGVVSASTHASIKIYNDQESYDMWLFFYGQDPKKMPDIVYYGQKEKD